MVSNRCCDVIGPEQGEESNADVRLRRNIDQLAKCNTSHCYEHVLRNGRMKFFRKVLECELKSTVIEVYQRKFCYYSRNEQNH